MYRFSDDEIQAVFGAQVPCRRCGRAVTWMSEPWEWSEEDDDGQLTSVVCGDCFTAEELADAAEAIALLRYVEPPL